MQVFVGNLGKDPELKFTTGGIALGKFSLAVTPRFRDESGEWVDGETVWYSVSCWRTLAEAVTETLRKGDRVIVVGSVKERTFDRSDGTVGTALEIEAQDVGKALSRWKGFQRSASTETGLTSSKDAVVEAFPGSAVVDEIPF